MKCWICGNKGNTGEHLLKASDLKSHFGHVSQKKPLYFHTDRKKNIPLGSIKGKRLKSKALICNSCNSNLTQPYDKAWEKLSAYLRTNWTALNKTKKLDLSKIFPGSSKKSLLDVHLYFVKLFGCRIIENNIPIDINGFSKALQNRIAHPDIYISIGNRPGVINHKYAGVTPIESVNEGDRSVFATWLYMIDNIAVNILYSTVPGNEIALHNTWHPSMSSKILKLTKF